MSSVFRSLRTPRFRVWFAAALMSNIGIWMQRVAQDWLVFTELTDNDATLVGVTTALHFAPQVILLPLTATVADRFGRRAVMFTSRAIMVALASAMGVLVITGSAELWSTLVLAGCLGVASAFDTPARLAFVTELVPRDAVTSAVALNATSFNGARMVGPALAGVLIASVGTGWVLIISAATSIAVLATIPFVRSAIPVARIEGDARGFTPALRYLAARPDITVALAVVFVVGMFGLNTSLYIVGMSRVEFESGATAFGVLSSVLALGAVLGSLLTGAQGTPRLRVVVASTALFGLSLGLAALSPDIIIFAVTLLLIGVFSLGSMTAVNTYVQVNVDAHMRTRVAAIYVAVLTGGAPIGAPVLGFIIDVWGPRWGIVACAVSTLLVAGGAALVLRRIQRADDQLPPR